MRISRKALAALVGGIALTVSVAPAAHATDLFDPALTWRTIETKHFRIDYPVGDEEVAGKISTFIEEVYDEVTTYVGTKPPFKVDIVVNDSEDSSNGLALPQPSDTIFIYPTSPSPTDMGYDWKLGHYDDWLRLVLTHEFTHILHFDTTEGPIGWIDAALGKVITPPVIFPNFLKEGFAVYDETKFTTDGRGRDGDFGMYLRMGALQHHFASIDQASAFDYADWPGGMSAYVYGTPFYQYLAEHYGPDAPVRFIRAAAMATNPPFTLDPPEFAALYLFHEPVSELWNDMLAEQTRKAQREKLAITRLPLTALTPVTLTHRDHRQPRWLADGTLLYTDSNGHRPVQLMENDLHGHVHPLFPKPTMGAWSIAQGRYIYFASPVGSNDYNSYADLFRYDLVTRQMKRLTVGARLMDPAASPDGRSILAVQDGDGQNSLVLLDPEGNIIRRLLAPDDFEQFSEPRWSPDGKQIVVSAWRDGTRDLYLVDPQTGALTALWRDSFADMYPTWSPDGKYILYTSDRPPIPGDPRVYDLHAYRLSDGAQFRVTNVLGGVFEPAISPDGKSIAVSRYGAWGYDIATLPYDPSSWAPEPRLPLLPEPVTHEPDYAALARSESVPYNPLPTLRPQALSVVPDLSWQSITNLGNLFSTPGNPATWLPTSLSMGIEQDDVLHEHSITADLVLWPGFGTLGGNVSYTNREFYPELSVGWARNFAGATTFLDPSKVVPGKALDPTNVASIYQLGDTLSVSATFPPIPYVLEANDWVDGHAWTVGAAVSQASNTFISRGQANGTLSNPAPLGAGDPAANLLGAGQQGSVSLIYRQSSTMAYAYPTGPARGSVWSLGLTSGLAVPSHQEYNQLLGDYRHFQPLPWWHNLLALRAQGVVNVGGSQGMALVGGLPALYSPAGGFNAGGLSVSNGGYNIVDLRTEIPSNILTVRGGYPFVQGNYAAEASAEYRFPIMEIEHGPWTLPIFFERLYGAAFLDAATVWGSGAVPPLLDAAGFELRVPVDVNSGLPQTQFEGPLEWRLGVSQGLNLAAGGQTELYWALGAAF